MYNLQIFPHALRNLPPGWYIRIAYPESSMFAFTVLAQNCILFYCVLLDGRELSIDQSSLCLFLVVIAMDFVKPNLLEL
jgi:hypothetical protein